MRRAWARAGAAAIVGAVLLLSGLGPLAGTDSPAKAPAANAATEPPKAAAKENKDAGEADGTEILGANAACYVCHMTFVKEEMATVHLKEKVGCIECHGPSEKHANDEHIGATKPDITFKREQIDASCLKCHDTHDAPAKAVVARFVERKLSRQSAAVCTECHGMHKIEKAVDAATGKPIAAAK